MNDPGPVHGGRCRANDVTGRAFALARLEIERHVESTYPCEGCGALFLGPSGLRSQPFPNVYDQSHARWPDQFPLSSHTAYQIDELEFEKSVASAADRGEHLWGIFHSHCDRRAYFSHLDSETAAPQKVELRPGLKWIVVSVTAGKANAIKVFAFRNGAFAETPQFRL